MATLKEKIIASGKKQPTFRKKGHKYSKGKDEYTSVTKFVHSFFEEFDTKGISKYVALARRKKGEKITATQVRKEWTKTADEGSFIHSEVEEFITSGKSPTHSKAKSAVMFLEDEGFADKDKYFLNSELMVWSDDYKLCGTSDLVIEDGSEYLSIVDWKTNKAIYKTSMKKGKIAPVKDLDDCNYIQYVLQLSTYAHIMEHEFNFKVGKLFLVHLLQGMYIKYEVPYMKSTVEAMIQWKLQNKQ